VLSSSRAVRFRLLPCTTIPYDSNLFPHSTELGKIRVRGQVSQEYPRHELTILLEDHGNDIIILNFSLSELLCILQKLCALEKLLLFWWLQGSNGRMWMKP